MTTRIFAGFLTVILLLSGTPFIAAQQTTSDNWGSLGSYANREVAVKTESQGMVFGVLTSADDSELKIKAVKGNGTSEMSFQRGAVKKVWLARLNESSRNTLKGAAIGAVAGAGVGLGLVLASRNDPSNDDGLIGAAIPLFAVPGALIGGVAGFFSRQKHKKDQLIYKK
jgi:ABC-type Fe3+ transport system permease subunit